MNTASDRLLRDSAREFEIPDITGRTLTLRRLDALDRLRLFKALGAELSLNTPYLGMALLASSVTAIDSVPVPSPVTEEQLESLVKRLGDAGITAVADALDAGEVDTGVTAAGN